MKTGDKIQFYKPGVGDGHQVTGTVQAVNGSTILVKVLTDHCAGRCSCRRYWPGDAVTIEFRHVQKFH